MAACSRRDVAASRTSEGQSSHPHSSCTTSMLRSANDVPLAGRLAMLRRAADAAEPAVDTATRPERRGRQNIMAARPASIFEKARERDGAALLSCKVHGAARAGILGGLSGSTCYQRPPRPVPAFTGILRPCALSWPLGPTHTEM